MRPITLLLALMLAACGGDAATPSHTGGATAEPDTADAGGGFSFPETVVAPDAGAGEADPGGIEDAPEVDPPDAEAPDAEAPDAGGPEAEAPEVEAPDDGAPDPGSTDACVPDCTGKECGPDGCGGLCGFCAVGLQCNSVHQCGEECVPQCDGKFCGPDGCDGTCGSCPGGFECGSDGKCYDVTCTPDCTDKLCGDDGCGGVCGTCAWGDLCAAGACVPGPCSGIAQEGSCDGTTSLLCVDGQKVVTDCTASPGYICGWNPDVGHFGCVPKKTCVPVCEGKQCGDDGCGGLCGKCPTGWPCGSGICQPAEGGGCGAFNALGKCIEGSLWYCDQGTLYRQDCAAQGKGCGWDAAKQVNSCK